MILGVPLVAGGLVLAPEVVELVAGSDFSGAAEPLRILLAAGALAWVNGVFGFALIAKDRQLSALWLNVSGLVFNIGLNFIFVPRYGIVAAAVITVASEILILTGSYSLMRRNFGFFPAPRTLAPAVAAAAAMAGLLWLLDDLFVPLTALLGVGLYGVVLWAISPASRAVASGLRRTGRA